MSRKEEELRKNLTKREEECRELQEELSSTQATLLKAAEYGQMLLAQIEKMGEDLEAAASREQREQTARENAESSFYSIQQECTQLKERLDSIMSEADHDESKLQEQHARVVEASQQQRHRIQQLEGDANNFTAEIDQLLVNMQTLRSENDGLRKRQRDADNEELRSKQQQINTLNRTIESLETSMGTAASDSEVRLSQITAELDAARSEIKQGQHGGRQGDARLAQQLKDMTHQHEYEMQDLHAQLRDAKASLAEAREELVQQAAHERQTDSLFAEMQPKQDLIVQELTLKVEDLTQQLQSKEAAYQSLKGSFAETSASHAQAQRDLVETESEIAELSARLNQQDTTIKRQAAELSLLNTSLEGHMTASALLLKEKRDLVERVSVLQTQLEQEQADKSRAEASVDRAQQEQASHAMEVERQTAALQQAVQTLEATIQDAKHTSSIDAQQHNEHIEKLRADLQSKIAALANSNDQLHEYEQQLIQAQKERDILQTSLLQLQGTLQSMDAELANALSSKKDSDERLGQVTRDLSFTEASNAALQSKLQALQQSEAALHAKLHSLASVSESSKEQSTAEFLQLNEQVSHLRAQLADAVASAETAKRDHAQALQALTAKHTEAEQMRLKTADSATTQLQQQIQQLHMQHSQHQSTLNDVTTRLSKKIDLLEADKQAASSQLQQQQEQLKAALVAADVAETKSALLERESASMIDAMLVEKENLGSNVQRLTLTNEILLKQLTDARIQSETHAKSAGVHERDMQESIDVMQQKVAELSLAIERKAAEIEALNDLLVQKEMTIENEQARVAVSIRLISESQAKVLAMEQLLREATEANDELQHARDHAARDAELQLAKLTTGLGRANDDIKALQHDKADLLQKTNELQDEIRALHRKTEGSGREIDDLTESLRQLNLELDEHRTAGASDASGLLAGKGFRINPKLLEAEDKIDELKERLNAESLAKRELERRHAVELQALSRKSDQLADELSRTKHKLSAAHAEAETTDARCSQLQRDVDEQVKRRTAMAKGKEDELQRKQVAHDKLMDDLSVLQEELTATLSELQAAKEDVDRLNGEVSASQQYCDELQDEVVLHKLHGEDLEQAFAALQQELDAKEQSADDVQQARQSQAKLVLEKQQKIADLERQNKSLLNQLQDASIKLGDNLQLISSLESRLYTAQRREKEALDDLLKAQLQPPQIVRVPAPAPAPEHRAIAQAVAAAHVPEAKPEVQFKFTPFAFDTPAKTESSKKTSEAKDFFAKIKSQKPKTKGVSYKMDLETLSMFELDMPPKGNFCSVSGVLKRDTPKRGDD